MQFEIKFKNREIFEEKISSVDCSVPARTSGRKTEHGEMYCLSIYLRSLFMRGSLIFPLEVKKFESPDFLIRNGEDFLIGLEVVQASVEKDQKLMRQLEKEPEGTFLEGVIINGRYNGRLVKIGEDLLTEGMAGDSVEKEWVAVFSRAIYEKTKLLDGSYPKIPTRYDLLIYDNSPFVGLNTPMALSLLRHVIQGDSCFKSFERSYHYISIIRNDDVMWNVLGR